MPNDYNALYPPGALNLLDNTEFQNQINQQMGIGNNQARGDALNAGLINFGAGLIGGPTLKEGLSKGLVGFNQAYNANLNANKPKVTPLADGAYSQITLPDGTTKIVGNKQVADFLLKKWDSQNQFKLNLADRNSQNGVAADAEKLQYHDLVKQAGGVDAPTEFNPQVRTDIDKLDQISNWYKTAKPDVILGIDSPVGSDLYNRSIGYLKGSPEYKMLRDFDQYIGENLLKKAELMKGALSDKDVAFLQSMNVSTKDPTKRKIEYLTEYSKRLKEGEERRMEAAKKIRNMNQRPSGNGSSSSNGSNGSSGGSSNSSPASSTSYSPTGNADDAVFFQK